MQRRERLCIKQIADVLRRAFGGSLQMQNLRPNFARIAVLGV